MVITYILLKPTPTQGSTDAWPLRVGLGAYWLCAFFASLLNSMQVRRPLLTTVIAFLVASASCAVLFFVAAIVLIPIIGS